MKKVIVSCLILIAMLLTISCRKSDIDTSGKLSVKAVLASPKKFQDKTVTVAGIIYSLQKEENKMQLVDLTECISSCNTTTCKVLTLPVHYKNASVPEVGSKVVVTGKITKSEGKFSFVVSQIGAYNED